MLRDYDQMLSETVKLADIAVRTASQLRLLRHNKPIEDHQALLRSIEFLTRASEGGVFISGQSSSLQRSLRPLNWAMDAYLELQPATNPDYKKVSEYLDRVLADLRSVIQAPAAVQAEKIDFVAPSFGKLGDILGSVADQKL